MHRAHVTYRVPYADTDMMGVVYYGNYLTYFERARTALLRDLGFPYRALEETGFALPVVEAHLRYRSSATYDDLLDITGWLGWKRAVRVRVDCAVYCRGELLAEGHTVHAFVDGKTLRPTRMPEHIASIFQAALDADGSDPATAGTSDGNEP